MSSLSVFIPNYNHGKYLRQPLTAILNQSRRPEEILVLDDASTDDSWSILEEFAAREPWIKVARNTENRGVLFGINWGLENVKGDYVYFASSDDMILPGFFEEAMALLDRYPHASHCFSYPSLMDAEGRLVSHMRDGFHWSDHPCYFSPGELVGILNGRHVCGHCVVVRRQALIDAGGFRHELKWHSDWFAEMVMAFRHGICYIPKTFAFQRMMPGTYSSAGQAHWPSQRESLLAIFRCLNSDAYRDVLPHFQASNAMVHQRLDTVRALLSSPEDWSLENFKLIRVALSQVFQSDEAMRLYLPLNTPATRAGQPLPPTAPRYQIVLVKPEGFEHVEAFREIMESLQAGFAELGLTTPISTNRIEEGAIPILFGAHHLAEGEENRLPQNTIIYNTEQLLPGYPWASERYLNMLSRFQVWDFSEKNLPTLIKLRGSFEALHVPVGYAPLLTRITPTIQDIDVLFYGRLNERRMAVLQQLQSAGVRVHALSSTYGAERDKWISRSRIVLSMHAADGGYFESARIVYLLANSKVVVCEGDAIEEVEPDLREALIIAPYTQLVAACLETLNASPSQLSTLALKGFRAVTAKSRSITQILSTAIPSLALHTENDGLVRKYEERVFPQN